jgi:hypothetical protein
LLIAIAMTGYTSFGQLAKNSASETSASKQPAAIQAENKSYFIDVHDLEPGKLNFDDVKAAHQKDLATEGKYDVNFIKFWVDEKGRKVYCLSSAKDSQSIVQTHAEAHGLLPSHVFKVTQGTEVKAAGGKKLFIDVHQLGSGNVAAAAVAEAHKKDPAVEKKYGVNFIDYWVEVKSGSIFCL